jgi:hypothetical protein
MSLGQKARVETARSAGFAVCRVLDTAWAELRKFQTVWVVATVLLGDVVAFLAVHACERDLWANVCTLACHGLATSRAASAQRITNKKHALGRADEVIL